MLSFFRSAGWSNLRGVSDSPDPATLPVETSNVSDSRVPVAELRGVVRRYTVGPPAVVSSSSSGAGETSGPYAARPEPVEGRPSTGSGRAEENPEPLRAPTSSASGAANGASTGVEGVDLALYPGEVLALLGPSGCGKTTTLRLLAGFERPDAGQVWIEGRLVATPASSGNGPAVWQPPERRNLGMVFQDYALFPHLTVEENVAFGLRVRTAARRARVASLVETVGLTAYARRYPHQLSGGQQQRVALARALAPRPRAVLLDEPFNTLDVGLRAQVRRDLLAILRAEGVAVLLVTHDQVEALTSADRVAVMRAGIVEQVASPAVLYNCPATRFVASFVGEGSFIPVLVGDGAVDTPFGSLPIGPSPVEHAGENIPAHPVLGPAELLVRPEEVAVAVDPAGNAAIVSRQVRGPDVDCDLAYEAARTSEQGSGQSGTIHVHADTWLPLGTDVRVRLRLRHLVLFQQGRAVFTRCLAAHCTCPAP